MHKVSILLLFVIMSIQAIAAPSLNAKLNEANILASEGAFDEALEIYNDVLIEDPDSEVIHYNIGHTNLGKANAAIGSGAAEEAGSALGAAEESFDKLKDAENKDIRVRANFNAANCIAQRAKMVAAGGDVKETVKAFAQSLSTYDEMLKEYPDHKGAKHNRDHMRYLLKSMLQNPPEEQEEQEKSEDGEEGEESEEEQEQQESEQSEQENKDEQEQNEQQESEEENEEQQQSEEEKQEEEQQQQKQADEQKEGEEKEQQTEGEKDEELDRQNIEAILQSLEEMDQHELKDAKAGKGGHAKGDWW